MTAVFRNIHFILIFLVWFCGLLFIWMLTSNVYHFAGNVVATYFLLWGLIFLFSKETKRERASCFILTNLSICIVVGFFELFALIKVVDYRLVFSTPITDPTRSPNYELDSELIFKHKPNTHIKGDFKGGNLSHLFHVPNPDTYRYDVRIDSSGFRNETDMNTADIAVLGDSFIEGAEVYSHELLTSRLSQLQEKSVANLGTIHYGPQQELIVLKRYALPLKPEIIVWAFYEGNDLRNIYDYKEVMEDWESNAKIFHSSLLQRSFTKNAFLAVSRLFGNTKPSALKRSGIVKITEGGNGERIYFLFEGKPFSNRDMRALDKMSSILSDAYDLTAKEGIKLIVVFIPTKFRAYHDLVECDVESDCYNWVVNDLPTRFRRMVSEISNEIGYIDLTPKLVESAKTGAGPYFIDDSHWSPEGHLIAAKAVNEYVSMEVEKSIKAFDIKGGT